MLLYLRLVFATCQRAGAPRRDLLWENLALRQQLAVYQRQTHRPPVRQRDRLFWSVVGPQKADRVGDCATARSSSLCGSKTASPSHAARPARRCVDGGRPPGFSADRVADLAHDHRGQQWSGDGPTGAAHAFEADSRGAGAGSAGSGSALRGVRPEGIDMGRVGATDPPDERGCLHSLEAVLVLQPAVE